MELLGCEFKKMPNEATENHGKIGTMRNKTAASEKTKTRLINVARDLFAKKGYSETSIRDILTAANISKGNLYHHFKGKEFLFLHIIEEDNQEWINQWEDQKQQDYKNAIEKLYGLAEFMVKVSFHYPLFHASEEFFLSAFSSQEVVERLNKIDDQYYEMVASILEEGNYDGSWTIHNIEMTTKILSSLLYGLDISSKDSTKQQKQELHRQAISIFIKGVR